MNENCKITTDLLKILPVELKGVNTPEAANLYGTEELEDFVDLIYSSMEAYEKAMNDARLGLNDLILLGNVLVNIVSAINGTNQAFNESMDLTDDEITDLVNLAEKFELGSATQKYKQIVKELLMKFQSYSIFIK